MHWLPEFACSQSKHCIQRVFLKIKLQSLQIPLHCEADFVYSSLKIWYFTLWPMYVFKITFNVFKKKGWSYIQVISLSHLNNAISFLPDFSLPFTPFFHMTWRKTYISTISLDHVKTIQITETCLLCIFNKFWDTNLWYIYMKFQISETCLWYVLTFHASATSPW